MIKGELQRIKIAMSIPFVLLCAMWIIHLVTSLFPIELGVYGVLPRTIHGLKGIVFAPFIHGDWSHLMANSLPFFVLSTTLFYFYQKIRFRVFIGIWIFSEALLWLGGRNSYHIGASGVVYGLAAFLFLSGILRREKASMVISLLVSFLYGSMIWGVLPWFSKPNVSWEGHLWGFLVGFLLAFYYKKKDRQRKKYSWETADTDIEESEEDAYWNVPLPESETRKRKINIKGETAIILFLFLAFVAFLFLFRYGKEFM
ncbi:MAG: rhomboid family intramembrane serine protease [Bacteroidales bacterium]